MGHVLRCVLLPKWSVICGFCLLPGLAGQAASKPRRAMPGQLSDRGAGAGQHGGRFFKPRHYLLHCFPELAAPGRRTVLEVGCGAGDTAFSLLELNPDLTVLACDFSATAVATVRAR